LQDKEIVMPRESFDEEKLDTVVGAGTEFEGNIKVKGGVRIDGTFKGKLNVQGLLAVGKSGHVDAEVQVKDASIAGRVKGNAKVEEKVEFLSGARFEGDLVCKGLVIQEGVIFDGSCSMSKQGTLIPESKPEHEETPSKGTQSSLGTMETPGKKVLKPAVEKKDVR
jgi:cytoskeletal protein CcmA (bactofilin family)